jgi:hypothetical protein
MFQEPADQPLAREAVALNLTMDELSQTALRILAERNDAIRLLKRTLEVAEMGRYAEAAALIEVISKAASDPAVDVNKLER